MKYLSDFSIFNESLDTPAPIKWSISSNKIKGIFYIGEEGEYKEKYVIVAKKYPDYQGLNVWNFKFYWNDGGDIIIKLTSLNKGKFKILATIVDGFKYIMSKMPDAITFMANIEEDSRIKFYNTLCKKAEEKYGLKLSKFITKTKDTNFMAYCLYMDDKNKDIITNTFAKIIPQLKKLG
jgi:hypothetical protein